MMLISAEISVWPKSKVFEKNLSHQNILLEGINALTQLFLVEISEV